MHLKKIYLLVKDYSDNQKLIARDRLYAPS